MTRVRRLSRENLGFLLAKASARWNEVLYQRFSRQGYADIRPAYGSILIPLFEEDGLQIGELGRRARLSKQTMTTMVRKMEERKLVSRKRDPEDGRAYRIHLTARSRPFRKVAEAVLKEMDEKMLKILSSRRLDTLQNSLRKVMELPSGGQRT